MCETHRSVVQKEKSPEIPPLATMLTPFPLSKSRRPRQKQGSNTLGRKSASPHMYEQKLVDVQEFFDVLRTEASWQAYPRSISRVVGVPVVFLELAKKEPRRHQGEEKPDKIILSDIDSWKA